MMEITLELSDSVVMQSKHTMSHIFQQQKISTCLPVSKTLIKYNGNSSKEMKKRRSQIILSLLNKKLILNDENAIDFRWSGAQEGDEEDIALVNFIESLRKQTDEEIYF